jgi:hypothetical protein
MNEKYDIKGSWINRNAARTSTGKRSICRYCNEYFVEGVSTERCSEVIGFHEASITFKDNDMINKLRLQPQDAYAVIDVLYCDSDALCAMGVTDYSLLIGVKNILYDLDYTNDCHNNNSNNKNNNNYNNNNNNSNDDNNNNNSSNNDNNKNNNVNNNNNNNYNYDSNNNNDNKNDDNKNVKNILKEIMNKQPFQFNHHQNENENRTLNKNEAKKNVLYVSSSSKNTPGFCDLKNTNHSNNNNNEKNNNNNFNNNNNNKNEIANEINYKHYLEVNKNKINGYQARAVIAPNSYFFGMIDMLETWTFSKKFERLYKIYVLGKPGEGLSCMSPEDYKVRFQQKIARIIEHSIFVREITGSWTGKRFYFFLMLFYYY